MKVRYKTTLILVLTLVGLLVVLYASSQVILLHSYRKLETNLVLRSLQSIEDALAHEQKIFANMANDWAQWDDMYAFVRDRNPDFIASNLVESTFSNLRINAMLILDARGRLVYGKGFDLRNAHSAPLPTGLLRHITSDSPLRTPRRAGQYRAGILNLPGGLLLVDAHPILTSTGTGPARGWLIIGRYIDEEMHEALRSVTSLDFRLTPSATATAGGIFHTLTRVRESTVVPVDGKFIAGYRLLADLYHKPVLGLRVQMPRDIYLQGQSTIRYFILWLVGSGLTLGLVTILVLERNLLLRLARLHEGVSEIRTTGDMTTRIHVPGDDELTTLAVSVNGMLDALESSRQEELRRQEALQESEARYRNLFDVEPDALILIDVTTLAVLEANAATLQLYGYPPEEFFRLAITDLSDEPENTLRMIREEQSGQTVHVDQRLHRKKDGTVFPVEFTGTFFSSYGRPVAYLAIRDITERQNAQARLNFLAYYDDLTGLPNRLLFKDRMEHALARAHRTHQAVALIFIDLDRFKEVNDSLGHAVGDALLHAVGIILSSCIRESDTVARMSGDEFVIILPDLAQPLASAEATATRMLAAFANPVAVHEHEIFITPSLGIAIAPGDGLTVDTLMKHADLAMYRAKEEGRNTFRFFSTEMSAVLTQRRSLEAQLRKALEQQEFSLLYQPQVDPIQGRVQGVEALIRWQSSAGVIAPLDFIPLAEETGLIEPIGDWVLRTACAQACRWRDAGAADLRVAVNISARQFERQQFVADVQQILANCGLPPANLELEITESTAMRDWRRTATILNQLHASGIRIAIDDFGTGHCSFGYLKRFAVNTLKIDRTFIQDIIADRKNEAITRAILVLGQELGLTLIAECVEYPEQLAVLRAQGCELFQGYLFSKPLTAAECGAALRNPETILNTGAALRE